MANYLNRTPGSIEEVIAKQTASYREDSGYQKMFKKELDKAGKGIGSMSPAEKKAFFNKIDDKYKAKSEGIETMVPTKKDDDKKYIYESPDNGKTIYRREMKNYDDVSGVKLDSNIDWQEEATGLKHF